MTYLFQLFDFKKNGVIRNDDFMELAEKISKKAHEGEGKPVDLSRYELMIAIETFLTSDDKENPDNWVFGDDQSG